jgi:hypothetical protein
MSDERDARGEDNHAIAEKVRQLARQTLIAEIQQELFDLADRLDRMGEGNGTNSSGNQ